MTDPINIQPALDAFEAQTILINLMPSLDAERFTALVEVIEVQRRLLALLPLDDSDRTRMQAALDRLEAVVFEKAGN